MEYNYEKVAQSLRLMYVGNIIIIASILCTILAWIIPPLVFLVSMAVLGGTVISLVGLVKLRSEHRAYRNAVITLVIVFVVGLFANVPSFLNITLLVYHIMKRCQADDGSHSFHRISKNLLTLL